MSNARDRLRVLDTAEPPDLWRTVVQRKPGAVPEPKRPTFSRSRVFVIVLAGVVAVAGLGLVWRMFQGGGGAPVSTPAESGPATPLPSLVAQLRATAIHLPSTAFGIATSDTDVWLASYGRVLRVDQARDKVVASIPVPGLDDQDSIAVSAAVWVTVGGHHEVVEIDPNTNRVSATVHIPAYPVQIAADPTSVWVISATEGSGILRRIDPTSHSVTLRIELSGAPRFGVAAGEGSVWVGEAGDLLRVSPDGTLSRLPGGGGSPLAVGDGSVWEGNDSGVVRIDPTTGNVLAQFPTDLPPIGLAFADGSVWILTDTGSTSETIYLPDPKQPSTVLRIDSSTDRVDGRPVAVGMAPAWIAANANAWVAGFNDAGLLKIQPESGSP